MKKNFALSLSLLILALGLFSLAVYFFPRPFIQIKNNLAAIFFFDTVTTSGLQNKYVQANQPSTGKKIKILIIPGHEPDFGGAEYRDLKERDMTVELTDRLATYLRYDSRFEVVQARDKNNWNKELADYFENHWQDIRNWMLVQKLTMQTLVDNNTVAVSPQNPHADADPSAAIRLYGINKWAGENKFDIAIHVHFNDYGFRNSGMYGQYQGMMIYVPDRQFSNASASRKIAESIFGELNRAYATSTAPKEGAGVVEDQKLIAVGSNNSADSASMLIEYGYIYELRFSTPVLREVMFDDMAWRTYQGLEKFFR